MTQAQVSYTDSCPLVLRYPVTGSLESVRLSSDVRERLIVECFTNNGVAGVKFREDEEEGWTPVSRRRSRRRKMGPGRTSGDSVDPVTIPDEATVFSIWWLGLLYSPCEPAGESGIGCPLQQELGTDQNIELSCWRSGSMINHNGHAAL